MLYFGEQELAAILLSLKIAIWATFLSLPFAVWVAFLLVRRRFWGREVLNALVHLPLILPPVVTGYLTITMPMALPGVVVGAILGFAKALGEFGATITFVGNIPNQTQTIPSAIYGFLQMPGKDQGALTLVFVSIVISVTALLLSEWLARRVQKRVHGQ
ncbi:MAG: ABC transporter permease subunit [Rhodobacteraceae bacterium]|nr:ABC transporter permease subunit [Paracoccaceae bacterium]